MRAIVIGHHGGAGMLRFQELDDPVAGPGEIVVDVAAAGVNFADVYQREGKAPYARPLPHVVGSEGAGVVSSVGDGVADLEVGDHVAWAAAPGSYAEKVVVDARRAVPVPAGVDLRLAAAVMLQGMTAHYLSHSTFPISTGDLAVVHAGAGGVGLLLTQLVRMRGGVVIATTSTPEKAALARGAGANHLAGYADFGRVVAKVSEDSGGSGVPGAAGASVVYDGVGASTFDAGLACLRMRGCMVLYGAASGPVPPFDLARLSTGGSLFVTRPTLASFTSTRDELLQRSGDLFRWIRDGKLDVRIGATYPLAEAERAQRDLEARRTTGKLLLLPG